MSKGHSSVKQPSGAAQGGKPLLSRPRARDELSPSPGVFVCELPSDDPAFAEGSSRGGREPVLARPRCCRSLKDRKVKQEQTDGYSRFLISVGLPGV